MSVQDDEIEEIGKGVDILRELALAANEEIKIQNKMLDTLEEKVGSDFSLDAFVLIVMWRYVTFVCIH